MKLTMTKILKRKIGKVEGPTALTKVQIAEISGGGWLPPGSEPPKQPTPPPVAYA